jgi:hypothetical protein
MLSEKSSQVFSPSYVRSGQKFTHELAGWLFQKDKRGKAFVTKGFFLRRRDREFFKKLEGCLRSYFHDLDISWLVKANSLNTRLGFLFLYVEKNGNQYREGATFSLLLTNDFNPKWRDWHEVSIEPSIDDKSCKVRFHLAKHDVNQLIQHECFEREIVNHGEPVLQLIDEFVSEAYMDDERQWECWSHWWLKAAVNLPFHSPLRFTKKQGV